jgi:FAD/FMN-containing dehydrogenase
MSDAGPSRLDGRTLWRGDASYEQVRQNELFNRLTPDRCPDVIVIAASEGDVVDAVELARARGLKVAVRAGGHSWCGSPLRNGGMLIDLSRLTEFSIDSQSRTASLQPNVTARDFALALAEHNLAFPVGHCGPVGLSGFLLSGGLGWNAGVWGPSCVSVEEIEVVTADGQLIRANEHENPDLFWAARGAGPGFFGVVTRFRVRLQTLPGAITTSTYRYPLSCVEQVARWASEITTALAPSVELTIVLTSGPPETATVAEKVVVVTATAFVDSPQQAKESLAVLETCPVLSRALTRQVNEPSPWEALFAFWDQLAPEHHRYAADTLWSNADFTAALPRLARHITASPSEKSFMFAVMPPPPPEGTQPPDMAFSMVGPLYLAWYAVWQDPAHDEDNVAWLREVMTTVEPLGIGHYIAESDLPAAPARAQGSFAQPQWQRLEQLRAEYDTDGVFHTYLGLPEA